MEHNGLLTCAIGFGGGLFLSFPFCLLARWIGPRLGQLDHPGGHKEHQQAVPATGGVAVFWTVALLFVSGLLVASPRIPGPDILQRLHARQSELLVVFAGAFALHVLGLIDDRIRIRPSVKLAVQVLACLPLVLWFDLRLLPQWLGPLPSALLTLVWLVMVVNAFNFLDGLDGLCGAVASITAAVFAAVALVADQSVSAALLSTLVGASVGFLMFNWPPATLYLGDAGSLVLGYLIAYASVRITYLDTGLPISATWYAVFTPLVVLAVPLYDLMTVVAIRWKQGKPLTVSDRQHLVHRLELHGLSPRRILVIVSACTLATAIGGLILIKVGPWKAVLVAVQTVVVLLVLFLLEGVDSYAQR